VVSAQAVVSCSAYNQGCDGGYPYLVGKFAKDVGMVPAVCMKYTAQNSACQVTSDCATSVVEASGVTGFMQLRGSRSDAGDGLVAYTKLPHSHVLDWGYVGGYYGACSEDAMKRALMRGPIAMVMYAPGDLFYYSQGIYNTPHTPPSFVEKVGASRWEKSNHAVTLVGYDEDDQGRPYWIVKNSWGDSWAMSGFFYVARGKDLLSAESSAVEFIPHM
jgi:cathepsin C